MNCPNCGHENPEGNTFCESCGTPIEQAAGTVPAPAGQPTQQAHVSQQTVAAAPQEQTGQQQEPQQEPQQVQQPQPKKSHGGAIAAIVIGVAVAVAGVFFAINMQHQSELPVVYGTFSDSRPASDDHGQFLSFQVEEDTASSNAGQHFAIITTEWVPGKYDLDGYEVELESDHIDIVARVALQDEGDKVTFTPAETLSSGINWQVSGSFDKNSVTLEEGYWTIETPEGMSVPVYVDHLTLPYGSAKLA